VTGAVFEGVGEVLLVPPDRAERTSLALFTQSAVLEQGFASAYFRFFDDKLLDELRAGFRQGQDAQEFITRWQQPANVLARADSLAILGAMTNAEGASSTFLHLRLGGTTLGILDLFLDTNSTEQISVAQAGISKDAVYYNTWTSFPMRSARQSKSQPRSQVEVSDYHIRAKLLPPTDLSAEAEFTLTPQRSGQRAIVVQLSRYLKVAEVRLNGQPVEFIQNEAMDGSDLARRGDDLVGVIFPAPLKKDQPVNVAFKYAGPVMFDTGQEVIYVGARGTWYPNAGPSFAKYDLSFEYPSEWSLVATGRQTSSAAANGQQTTHFVTDKLMARVGFNLGKFETATSTAGSVAIHAYAARYVERALAGPEARAGKHPDPAKEVQRIAEQAATTVAFLSSELDAFPYPNLEVTQLPALLSQSWPGLIYLSSMAYLTPDERRALGVHDPYFEMLLGKLMLSHETAHQWWGDAVDWASYRDEWIVEALANYSALLMLEKEHPETMKLALDHYRNDLLKPRPNGILADAGAVTLGPRLTSSKFPDAFEPVLYGRGTWLIHMLRTMLRQASGGNSDALFFSALKGLLAKSENHKISTSDLQRAFEQVLPRSLIYDRQKSLDWFFDGWVNGASVPQFSLENVRMTATATAVKVSGTVQQSNGAQGLVTAVPLYAVTTEGKQRFLAFVFADEPKTEFTLTAPVGTKQLLLDPEGTVLRR